MSILINKDTKVAVWGMTGKYGIKQTKNMLSYGTKIVAGISVSRGGEEVNGVPIYDMVSEAIRHTEINTGIIYVPPVRAKDAAIEAIDAGIKVLMIATEGMPLHDTILIKRLAEARGTWVIGPNTVGIITPGECLVGSLASDYAMKGRVGVVTRGGTIAVELTRMMSAAGFGQSTCVGAGGDKVIGKNMADYLQLFEKDPDTDVVVLNGEIGGHKEFECAEVISGMKKKVIAYILGRCAPAGKRMGHIGAIIGGKDEGFEEKREVLRQAGAIVVDTPWMILEELNKLGLKQKNSAVISLN